jgi:hypothetical protein
MILKQDSLLHLNINFFGSNWPRFEKLSYAKNALAYRINWEIPQADESGST